MQATAASTTARVHDAPSQSRRCRWLVRGVFFAGFWAYVWLVIRPRLIYDAFGIYLPYPEFTADGACLRQALTGPGGLVEYCAAFLSQWFSVPVLGALIITAMAGLIGFGTERLMQETGGMGSMGGRGARLREFLSLLPALGVLILYRVYYHPLAALLGLAICLWVSVAYPMLAVWRPVVFLAFCVGLYYLAGTVCLLFGLLVGTWYACVRRRLMAGAGAIVASVLVPWLGGTKLFYLTAVEAYSVAWPFGSGVASDMESWPLNVLRALFLFPLGMLLIVALCRLLPRAVQDGGQEYSRRGGQALRVIVELMVLAAAIAAVHQFLRAPHRKVRFEMVHFTHQRQWDQVLLAARQVPPSGHDCFSRHLVNRALYHAGQLGDELFLFSQEPAALLLLSGDVPHNAPKFWMLSEIAWELGDVNLAEQWTFERIEGVGECPSALELLAMVWLAKVPVGESLRDALRVSERLAHGPSPGREAARVVLNRMKKNVVQGRRARALLSLLLEPPPAGDPWLEEIARVRALRCTSDRVYQVESEEAMLQGLLQANPRNRMAFEYLMAYYLIVRRTDKLVEQLHRLDEFGYREIPRHYEEALLIHANETAQQVDLHGRKIRPETLQRFQAFLDCARPLEDQPRLALGALARDFGNSYFYYYAFGLSGIGGPRQSPDPRGPLAGVSGYGMRGTGGSR